MKYKKGQMFIRDFSDKKIEGVTDNGVIIDGKEVSQCLYTLEQINGQKMILKNNSTGQVKELNTSYLYECLKPIEALRTLRVVKSEDRAGETFGVKWSLIGTDMRRRDAITRYIISGNYEDLRMLSLVNLGLKLPPEQELTGGRVSVTDYGDSVRQQTTYTYNFPMPGKDRILETTEKKIKDAVGMTFFEEKDFIFGDFSNIDFDFSLFE